MRLEHELLVEDEDEIRYSVSAPVDVRTKDVSDTLKPRRRWQRRRPLGREEVHVKLRCLFAPNIELVANVYVISFRPEACGYDVGPLVGAGGMGEVYRARDSKLNRDVAIKILLPAVAE